MGELTLRGTTKTVTFDLVARRNGADIEVTGSLVIVFDEWGIPNPSFRKPINDPGNRFRVDDLRQIDAWINATVMF